MFIEFWLLAVIVGLFFIAGAIAAALVLVWSAIVFGDDAPSDKYSRNIWS